jgi:uncharacterized protein
MKLIVDQLTDAPTEFAFEAHSEWWRDPASTGTGEARLETLRFELRAHRMIEDLYLEGRAAGDFELECSRCLARYRHALQEPFRLVLEPAGSRRPPDPEGAAALERDGLYLCDEFETGWFRGDQIDLGGFFREVVALALPVKPLCREDCRGLCPQCGVDRNNAACECEQVRPDSPFAALRSLRAGRTGEA